MFLQIKLWQVLLAVLIFSPLALIPSTGRGALVSSRAHSPELSKEATAFLSAGEAASLAAGQYPLQVGGEESDNPLSTSDVAAIILTALALGAVIGFVIQQQD